MFNVIGIRYTGEQRVCFTRDNENDAVCIAWDLSLEKWFLHVLVVNTITNETVVKYDLY